MSLSGSWFIVEDSQPAGKISKEASAEARNPALASLAVFVAGALAGACTGTLYRPFKIKNRRNVESRVRMLNGIYLMMCNPGESKIGLPGGGEIGESSVK